MSTNPQHTAGGSGNNPDKGLNVRTFSISVLIALVILLAVGFFVVRATSPAASPEQHQSPASAGPQGTNGPSEGGHTQTQ